MLLGLLVNGLDRSRGVHLLLGLMMLLLLLLLDSRIIRLLLVLLWLHVGRRDLSLVDRLVGGIGVHGAAVLLVVDVVAGDNGSDTRRDRVAVQACLTMTMEHDAVNRQRGDEESAEVGV